MSLFGLLNTGSTGLAAQGFGLAVTAQNAQNAGTDGYSRRDVRMVPLPPPPDGGGGVRATGSRRIVDRYLEQRLLGATSARAGAQSRADALAVLDSVLSEAEGSVGSALDDLEVAFAQLSARPADLGVRQSVLTAAERLGRAFDSASTQLIAQRDELDGRARDEVAGLNDRLARIGALGAQIAAAEVNGSEASDLRDQRDQLVREVAEQIPVTRIDQPDGRLTLLMGASASLVTPDGRSTPLRAEPDAGTGRVRLVRTAAGVDQDVTALATSGRIGGVLAARDGALQSVLEGLDQLAYDTAGAYDAAHAAGYGQDGTMGRALFAPLASASGAASALALSGTMEGHPELLAASSDPTLPGDNRNALSLGSLADSPISGGRTAQAVLGSLIASAGNAVQSAVRETELAGASEAQLRATRESISGVSMDEEMIALSRYQRGYQASLKVVQAADQMLQELLQMKR
ncbi:MAG: flagellar hook-associated protein FlgK [Sandaracinaceae bacterium]|nr:flagellar hook-associated protein FlgK [Sandaracinaceae bacterium]